jgi:hypothetical protein
MQIWRKLAEEGCLTEIPGERGGRGLTGDEDVGGAVLAVVDKEVGFGALRQRVLAGVRVRRPLRHLLPSLCCRSLGASGLWRKDFQMEAIGLGFRGGIELSAGLRKAPRHSTVFLSSLFFRLRYINFDKQSCP